MVTLGMMCHVLTVTTTLVLKVLSVARLITIFIFMFQIVNLSRRVTTLARQIKKKCMKKETCKKGSYRTYALNFCSLTICKKVYRKQG